MGKRRYQNNVFVGQSRNRPQRNCSNKEPQRKDRQHNNELCTADADIQRGKGHCNKCATAKEIISYRPQTRGRGAEKHPPFYAYKR